MLIVVGSPLLITPATWCFWVEERSLRHLSEDKEASWAHNFLGSVCLVGAVQVPGVSQWRKRVSSQPERRGLPFAHPESQDSGSILFGIVGWDSRSIQRRNESAEAIVSCKVGDWERCCFNLRDPDGM